jgi:hypothetical protein
VADDPAQHEDAEGDKAGGRSPQLAQQAGVVAQRDAVAFIEGVRCRQDETADAERRDTGGTGGTLHDTGLAEGGGMDSTGRL